MCNDPMKISNAFNNYFANIGPKLADKIKTTNNYTDDMHNQLPSSLVMEETTCADIINIIQNIKSKPSTRLDSMSTKLMKKNHMESVILPMAEMFNYNFIFL